MAAVGELVLVLGLLVSAHCEVRARDPEVEEEEELGGRGAAGGGRGGGGGPGLGRFGTVVFPPHLETLHSRTTETPPQGERGPHPTRTGNWCAFVQRRTVTIAENCGTEKYIIKSQSPCPSGIPDCHLVLYKLSTRPVYTQKKKILSSLQWRCCPGHGGYNCEDTVSDPGSSVLTGGSGPQLHGPGEWVWLLQQQHQGDQNHDQNHNQNHDQNHDQSDSHASVSKLHHTRYHDNQHNSTHPTHEPGHAHNPQQPQHQPKHPHPHQHQPKHPHPHQQQEQEDLRTETDRVEDTVSVQVLSDLNKNLCVSVSVLVADDVLYPEAPAALPVPHMMALVMSELQPILQGFNRSLEHLTLQVGALARDVAQLKGSQRGPELQAGPPEGPELDEAAEERLEARLDEVFQNIREVQRQLESQHADTENRLHSQNAMLHYNLTSFKMDVDMKLKRHQKMLQVSLQAVNTTLSELKLDQDQDQDQDWTTERQLDDHLLLLTPTPLRPLQPSDSSALWEAIERLDNMVVNNTVKVNGLIEDVEVNSGSIQQLRRDCTELERQLNQTARNTQILFMETGLEVEDAKVVVLRRVEELAGNVTQQNKQLQEVEADMDYLWDCKCKGLKDTVERLERDVANVTALANDNRLALEENNGEGLEQWGDASDWETAVAVLQRDLQQVKESLVSEQTRTRTLGHSMTQLNSSVMVSLDEHLGLKDADRKLREEMQHLSLSFNSLLKDAIRHSDVLELLLGEEVMEYLEWSVEDQEANSIPALKGQLRFLQEQVRGHNLSITSLLGNKPEDREEVPSADQPSSPHLPPHDWFPGGVRRSQGGEAARERQLLLHPAGGRPELRGDGSDLWNLERTVEELEQKVVRLEEKPCSCPNASSEREGLPGAVDAKLQAEVTWLKRGLEEHLRVFKNVFSNADVLTASDATLDLEKLWQLVKREGGRREKKRGGGREEAGGGGHHRNRRESSDVLPVPLSQSEASLLFVAGPPLSASGSFLVFQPSLNWGQFYSGGSFMAPLDGIYLFVLTLDLRPGPAHVVLRKGLGEAPVSLLRQEVTEAGPATGVGLLLLREREEVRLELRGGVWAESEDNVFTGLLLHRTT
ncbi:multimerin-2 [Seriola lalandi dorsalis]|uniref:multimerin-2 n=1 Tax=Seriola lalandi dorsalis TaxID=1841481 RepID=UPI000C6F9F10|nr:multimerin-2 [Seriola lalandi dorsalis]